MTSLNCSNNELTSLNVSTNTRLRTITCENNRLTELDVSGLALLEGLYCTSNQLESLKVGSGITYLDCSNNRLYGLDLSGLSSALGPFGNNLGGQIVDLDLTGGAGNYSVPITLKSPQFGDPLDITYTTGAAGTPDTLNSTNRSITSTSFGVETAEQNNMLLEGVMNFTYLDNYTVTVNNGTLDDGSSFGIYPETRTVYVTADAAPAGQRFDRWTVDNGGVALANPQQASSTLFQKGNFSSSGLGFLL